MTNTELIMCKPTNEEIEGMVELLSEWVKEFKQVKDAGTKDSVFTISDTNIRIPSM